MGKIRKMIWQLLVYKYVIYNNFLAKNKKHDTYNNIEENIMKIC